MRNVETRPFLCLPLLTLLLFASTANAETIELKSGDKLENVVVIERSEDRLVLEHPVLGPCPYERNGFRLSNGAGYTRPSPLLGEHTREVLTEWLGYSDADVERMAADGGVE